MNSYATTVWEYLRLTRKINELNGKLSERKILSALMDDRLDYETVARVFIRFNHTIGNFIPVPFERKQKEFNSPRGIGKMKDYWDLTLAAIYRWYTRKDDELLRCLLINGKDGEENVSLCKSWLERFGSWGKFVEENYMQDFVERPKNGSFGKPNELWNGHFADYLVCGCAKPDKLEQCEEFFQNASMWILARGERTVEKIIQELEKTPGCHPWK